MGLLRTYRWALLPVLLSIAALIAALAYFGLLNPSRSLPEPPSSRPTTTVTTTKSTTSTSALITSTSTPSTSLLFKSGFESSTTLSIPSVNQNNQWRQTILGTDQSTGFSWSSDLPRPLNTFSYWVNADKNLNDYVTTRIESVVSYTGNPSNVLFQEVKDSDPDLSLISRNEFLVYNGQTEDKLRQIYVRYWIKLQPDLNQLLPADGWRLLMEWREPNNVARWTLEARRDGSDADLSWRARGQTSPYKGNEGVLWSEENKVVAVPQGVWFPLEVFWKQSSGVDGRFWAAVNGQTIVDHYGPNKVSGRIDYWSIFKLYTGKESLALGTAYQWIDDVEIYLERPL